MKSQTLLLIADISGYTQFVARSDPDTGIQYAQEMLEIIVSSNDLGLKLCEIEGDAVFYYQCDGLPSYTQLLRQIRATFEKFQQYISEHDLCRDLGIKFFVHVGECQFLTVGGRTKLFGLDVIMIHRLLKGVVSSKNYLLMTRDATEKLFFSETGIRYKKVEFEHIGKVEYTVLNEAMLRSGHMPSQPSESHRDQLLGSLPLLLSELRLRFSRSAPKSIEVPTD